MAGRMILGAPNHVFDSETVTPSLSGGSWLSSLPLANLKEREFALKARTTSAAAAATTLTLDAGAVRNAVLVAIIGCNASLSGQVRFEFSLDSGFATLAHDSGWRDYWPVLYPIGTVPITDPHFWTGKLTAEERAGYPSQHVYVIDATPVRYRYLRVSFSDASNADGYLELQRLVVAPGWRPEKTMRVGWTLGWEAQDTQLQRALGGALFFTRNRSRRVARLELPATDRHNVLANLFEMRRTQGVDRDVFVVLDPDDQANLLRQAFLARFREDAPLTFIDSTYATSTLELEELIA